MRRPKYLSPTSMTKWAEDPNAYYRKYLSEVPLVEEPQTLPMAVGSAFDAYVKSYLSKALFGTASPAEFELDVIFESQVSAQHRDAARLAGEWCLSSYRQLGALDQLMIDLGRGRGVKFEMDVRASIGRNGVVGTVPFRVKPDLHYINEHGAFVILDWKVNGYCSKSGVSPLKGFVRARRSGKIPWPHGDARLEAYKGLLVNKASGLEEYDEGWARQTAIGAWVCGAAVGGEFVAVIHQLACAPGVMRPRITVAEHICFVSSLFQEKVFDEAVKMWEAINSDHVFRSLSLEDSKALCKLLDERVEGICGFINPALEE